MSKSDLLIFFFFFLMIRLPPRSPLFPYTTLSRSRSPFGLIASSCAMRRNEDRAVSRAITSRSRGTGSAGRLTRVGTDAGLRLGQGAPARLNRSEEHTSELQSRLHLVCRLLLEKKN